MNLVTGHARRPAPKCRRPCLPDSPLHSLSTLGRLGALALATRAAHSALACGRRTHRPCPGRLTPVGAERAANKDGSIPAWVPEKQDSGWTWGKKRLSGWKHKDDKPLFSVDASNVDKYADRLSPGQIATLKQVKGYRMDVYPTRRTCNVPDFVAENTRKNVGFAKLAANGWALQDAWVPGVLFPMPSNGTEAMWNMAMRYRGVATEFKGGTTLVSPRQGSSEWIRYVYDQTVFLPWAEKGSRKLSETGKNRSHTAFSYISPTALSGQAGVISDFLDQAGTETFYYFPGPAARQAPAQLRLRRTAGRLREPVRDRRGPGVPGRAGPLRLEAGRQEGTAGALQRVRGLRVRRQDDRHRPGRFSINPQKPPLRAAPRLGDRGHGEGRRAPSGAQAHLLPGRRQLERGAGRRLRRPGQALEGARRLPDSRCSRPAAATWWRSRSTTWSTTATCSTSTPQAPAPTCAGSPNPAVPR